MTGFIQGVNRYQETLLPERFDNQITEDKSVRAIDAFVDSLLLINLSFTTMPSYNGLPGYFCKGHTPDVGISGQVR